MVKMIRTGIVNKECFSTICYRCTSEFKFSIEDVKNASITEEGTLLLINCPICGGLCSCGVDGREIILEK